MNFAVEATASEFDWTTVFMVAVLAMMVLFMIRNGRKRKADAEADPGGGGHERTFRRGISHNVYQVTRQ